MRLIVYLLSLDVKGTVSRDFLLLVFFMNQFPPSPRVSANSGTTATAGTPAIAGLAAEQETPRS